MCIRETVKGFEWFSSLYTSNTGPHWLTLVYTKTPQSVFDCSQEKYTRVWTDVRASFEWTSPLILSLPGFKLPVSMEDVMDLLNEVNQQLADDGERDEDQVDYPLTSSPGQPTEPHVKFSTPSPSKSVMSPSKRSVVCHGTRVSACCLQCSTVPESDCCFLLQFSPKTPPHWAEDHKSLLQMLCQQVESLKVSHTSTTCSRISHLVYLF